MSLLSSKPCHFLPVHLASIPGPTGFTSTIITPNPTHTSLPMAHSAPSGSQCLPLLSPLPKHTSSSALAVPFSYHLCQEVLTAVSLPSSNDRPPAHQLTEHCFLPRPTSTHLTARMLPYFISHHIRLSLIGLLHLFFLSLAKM
jgi:hypothetical protein